MAFTLDDLKAYESQPQVDNPNHDPWGTTSAVPGGETKTPVPSPQAKEDAEVDAAIAASVAEPTEQGDNDGSSTEQVAEPVTAKTPNPEGEKDPDLEDSTDGRPRSRAQERIEELVAERNALRKYGEYLISQLEQRKSQGEAPKQESQPVPTTSNEDPAPTLESAEFDPVKLSKLQNEWIDRQVNKRVESAVKQFETRQSEVAIRQAFEARTVEFRKTTPDFDLVIANPALPSLAPAAAKVVIQSENGPAIAYHLAKNPDLAVRVARMEAVSQAAAIGRLEEQLVRAKTEVSNTKEPSSKTVAKAPAKVTQAPPPPKPVSGGSAPVSKDISQMSMEEWVAHERGRKIAEKQARQKLRASLR